MINDSQQEMFLEKTADFSDQSDLINLKLYLNDSQYTAFITQRLINDLFITNFNTKPDIDVIDYLLNDNQLPFNAKIDYANQICMQLSLNNEDVKVLDYLLNSEQGKSLLNIHHNLDKLYKNICDGENLDFLTYLIIDYKIDFTEEMKNYNHFFAKDSFNQKSLHLFSLRDLNDKLNEVNNQNTLVSTKKLKI